ncbi:MAG: hypothetical protein NTW46_03520, partial [Candidatus Nealsonbacteria bacterium]|nr:hypothetical protein [Candidatus Nealsonbacteria bacterium]
ATKAAKIRGYDFTTLQKRDFIDNKNFEIISNKLIEISLPQQELFERINTKKGFVRIGGSCDPSDDWNHTINIIEKISPYIKNIVVITKHWKELKEDQLPKLNNVCINTSVSALDSEQVIEKRLSWYNKLKKYCKSILRVNTADFNDKKLKKIQDDLLNNKIIIDTILRIDKNHELVKNNIVNIGKYKYMGATVFASKHDENVYFGYCDKCPDQCGVNL